jgi:hypothetical protein
LAITHPATDAEPDRDADEALQALRGLRDLIDSLIGVLVDRQRRVRRVLH